jgi:hypothetical protein
VFASNTAVAASNQAYAGSVAASYAFKFMVPLGTSVIASNYSPGVSTIGSNNQPINGLIPFSSNDTGLPYTTITSNGFQAPKAGIYGFNLNIGVKCRAYDCVQMVLTQTPSNRGPLINRDTLSNLRAYTIATAETWGNYFTGNPSAASDGYMQPGTSTLSVSIIDYINVGDFVQAFLVTHHTTRSNSGATPVLVQSNTPITIDLASNNIFGNSNPATAYNYFSGLLLA